MKIIKYELAGSYSDWEAMLPVSFKGSIELTELLDNSTWKPGAWKGTETIPFILVGDRTWDLSTEEMEELGYDGFAEKYPNGKPIHEPGANGEEFRDILNWGSIIMTEHNVVEHPGNKGDNVYRIISPKMKEVLEQFYLPPHRFYPAEVTHEVTGEKRPYFLFHLTYETGGYLNNAHWPMLKTIVYTEGEFDHDKWETTDDVILHEFEKGSFKDFKDFQHKYDKFLRERENVPLDRKFDLEKDEDYEFWDEKFSKYRSKEPYYIFTEPFDLIWMGTSMFISKDLKEALDKAFPNKQWYYERDEEGIDIITGYQPGEELPF